MVHSLTALPALLLLLATTGAFAADVAVDTPPAAADVSVAELIALDLEEEGAKTAETAAEAPADDAWDAFLATLPSEDGTSAKGDSPLTAKAESTVGKSTTDLGRAGTATLVAFLVLAGLFVIPSTRRRLLARLLQRPVSGNATQLDIDLRGARTLGSGQRVVALEVDGVRLLIGVSQSRMDVLHTWWSEAQPGLAPVSPTPAVLAVPTPKPEAAAVVEKVLAERRTPLMERSTPPRSEPTPAEMVGAWRRAPKPAAAPAPAAPTTEESPWWMEGATEMEQSRFSTLAEDKATDDVIRRVRARAAKPAAPKPALKPTGTEGVRKAARFVLLLMATVFLPTLLGFDVLEAAEPALRFEVGGAAEGGGSPAIKLLATLTLMAVAPALVLAMTSFTRLIVVFSLLRQAIGVQQAPPNQVLIGLALFLTWFIMGPTFTQVQQHALTPWMDGQLTEGEALEEAMGPMRKFMFKNTREDDLGLFLRMDRSPRPATRADVPSRVLVPSFLISELKTAFTIGFLLYIPFLVIDIVVATVLLAMGMMVLPPVVISLPFKLLLFVFVDGWNLLVGSLVSSFA
jgi:flagellar biosynthesis protein FliP